MKSISDCDYEHLLIKQKNERGPMFYVEPLDNVIGGMPNKFGIVAGFSGSYKSNFGINISYNSTINLGYNSGIVSLEMEADDIFTRLLVRHSQHLKFKKHNIVVTLKDIKTRSLTEHQEYFLLKTVAPDLKNNDARIVVFGPEDIFESFSSSGYSDHLVQPFRV